MAVSSAFYRVLQVKVQVAWLAPAQTGSTSTGLRPRSSTPLPLDRSIQSLQVKLLSPRKLILRDRLNLFGATGLSTMANMHPWFIVRPTARTPSRQQSRQWPPSLYHYDSPHILSGPGSGKQPQKPLKWTHTPEQVISPAKE